MRKANDKVLTKVVGDENHCGYAQLCRRQHEPPIRVILSQKLDMIYYICMNH